MAEKKIPDITVSVTEPGTWNMTRIWYKFFEQVIRINKGWTASTGTANKGAYAVYAGADPDLTALSQRVKALEDAMRSNGIIDG